jgi:hypothetical protein
VASRSALQLKPEPLDAIDHSTMQLIQAATGFLVERRDSGQPRLLGSCFAYGHPHLLLTAAHCVEGLPKERIGIATPSGNGNDSGLSINQVIMHPTADLAAITIADTGSPGVPEYFRGYETTAGWGDDFIAFGYPADASVEHGLRPTPRMFRGSIQRFFHHTSHNEYRYVAVELSIGAPGGLSGGPVCWPRDQSRVLGVVAENLESSTFLEKSEIVAEDGKVITHETRNIINYGLAVALYDVAAWLEEVSAVGDGI